MSNIYDLIKAPNLDELFKKMFTDDSTYYYNKAIVTDGSKDKNYYLECNKNFLRYVAFPLYTRIIEQLKTLDAKESVNVPFNPLDEFQELIEKYSLVEIYRRFVKNLSKYHQYQDKVLYKHLNREKKEYKVEDFIPDRDDVLSVKLIFQLNKWFRGEGFVMGFHNCSSKRNIAKTEPNVNPDMKFYLNAGPDTYLIAKLFGEECEKLGINYYYKVTQPFYDGEEKRCDRMCIFCELKDVGTYLNILKGIIAKHPEISWEKPPITTGLIDGVIGVGVDSNQSYNEIMGDALETVGKKFAEEKGIELKDLGKYLDSNLKAIIELKLKFIKYLENHGMDAKKLCITSKVAEELKNMSLSNKPIVEKPKKEEQLKPINDNILNLEPITLNDKTIVINGKEYILELDEEATMQNYRNSGYSQNAYGWYFDPSTDEYIKDYKPLNDPLFQIFNYYEVVQVLDEEATMQNYRNSGYSQNAYGWYFDPSSDEYIKGYNPLEDSLFQVFNSQKRFVGQYTKNQVPTSTNKVADDKKKKANKKPKNIKKEAPAKKEPVSKPNRKENNKKKYHNVKLNIIGSAVRKTTITISVLDGQPIFPLGSNNELVDGPEINKFRNACREILGTAEDYKIQRLGGVATDFNIYETPITQDMELSAFVAKYHRVNFVNEEKLIYSTLVKEGTCIDPNLVEKVDRAVDYGYNNPNEIDYLGQPESKRDVTPAMQAFTGIKYWGIYEDYEDDEKPEKFKFDQPIYENITLEAQTGVKSKGVVATAAGIASGVAIDLAGGPLAGGIAFAGAGVADRIANYKLNHHKEMVSHDEIQKMTGIKKASAKMNNYFRKTQTIKFLQYFIRGLMFGVSVVGANRLIRKAFPKIKL